MNARLSIKEPMLELLADFGVMNGFPVDELNKRLSFEGNDSVGEVEDEVVIWMEEDVEAAELGVEEGDASWGYEWLWW